MNEYIETQVKIKFLKDEFEKALAKKMNLIRVSAPIFVEKNTGLNDNLNGVEEPVRFNMGNHNIEIVHSLAKWKRVALKKYGFLPNTGLYADMNAIRKDEVLDEIHSIYVDQWDFEKIINKEDRTIQTLISIVEDIYQVFKETENLFLDKYQGYIRKLPERIFFISSEELLQAYPNSNAKERENQIAKRYGAVFISNIGCMLSDGSLHDDRSPDYDDYRFNGDIIFWNEVLNSAYEVCSMGIRVDKDSLVQQLIEKNVLDRLEFPYHKMVINDELPYTVGGGIGQSRLCMFFLEKRHIGEVQASIWTDEIIKDCKKKKINLL